VINYWQEKARAAGWSPPVESGLSLRDEILTIVKTMHGGAVTDELCETVANKIVKLVEKKEKKK